MYFIKRKAEYNTATVKEELSQANHTTKAEKNKREESSSRQTPTKLVERQLDTTKGKANQAKHDYLKL
jgi:hypothetical protein